MSIYDWPVIACIVLVSALMLLQAVMPRDRRATDLIEGWAEDNGYEVRDIEAEPFGAFDHMWRGTDSLETVYRVWLIAAGGEQAQCVVLVNPLFRRIRVSEAPVRSDEDRIG